MFDFIGLKFILHSVYFLFELIKDAFAIVLFGDAALIGFLKGDNVKELDMFDLIESKNYVDCGYI